MAKLIRSMYKCPVCGNEFEDEFAVEIGVDRRKGLDSNSYEDEIFKQVVMCPKCGYSTTQYPEKEDDEVIDFVESEDYQVLKNSEWESVYKKWMMAGYISKLVGNTFDSGYEFMVAGWYARRYLQSADDFNYSMGLAIRELSDHVNETGYLNAALLIVELLRQTSRLQEASDYAHEILDADIDDDSRLFLEFELKLISKLDITEHYFDEITEE